MKYLYAEKGFISDWDSYFLFRPLLAALLIVGLVAGAHAAPEGGIVRAGSAQIVGQGSTTLIQQSSPRAVIDWRGFSIQLNEQVRFDQPSQSSATLNRVTGSQVSLILGRMDANGQVLLINPNGIIFGQGAQINVGSLIASTANINNDNFMQGKLIFDQPGNPGAGIINAGSITADGGGLVALVAPHVRNDGLIQARLGKVIIGAADTFTVDLYGDGLINLALSDESLARLNNAQGQPVKSLINQTGTIDVGGGQAILVTAEAAKGMLDSLINMSGTILADSAIQEGGRILLMARGGNVDVSGDISARGTTGGLIEVLGKEVHLFPTTELAADGLYGGGTLHVGGAYQGGADTYRSGSTLIDAGVTLTASALTRGNGGEIVVWSDGDTFYAGSIQVRGGAEAGDGGLVEVSGKQRLFFNGLVDAGAMYGTAGSLLLDPYNFTIGIAEASLINRVLRSGTSTSVSADNDIDVNYAIDGRGRYAGGGLTLSAGNNINVNNYIITNNGAINLYAAIGTVNLAAGKVVYAGTAPITVRSGADLYNAPYLTGGLLSLISTKGSVFINQGIDAYIGNLWLQAAEDVNVNQPIVSFSDGNSVNINAGNNINVNAQINGSGGTPGGSVTLAAGANVNINEHVVTNNGPISIIGGGTIIQKADGLDSYGAPLTKQVRAGNAAISVTAGGNLSLGSLVTTGALNLTSTAGKIDIDVPIYETTGKTTVTAAGDIDIKQVAANTTSGSDLTLTSTSGNIYVNAKVGPWDRTTGTTIARDALPGGSITLEAYGNINVNKEIASYKGASPNASAITLTAGTGTVNLLDGIKVMSDSGAIHVTAYDDLNNGPYINDKGVDVFNAIPTTGYFTTGPLNLTSVAGNLTINQTIPHTTGEVTLRGGNAIKVNQRVYSNNANISLFAGPDGILMDPTLDPTTGNTGVLSDIDARGGNLTLEAQGDINASLLRTSGILRVKSTDGFISGGSVTDSRTGGYPALIELAGSKGISHFSTGGAQCAIKAISDRGTVHELSVDAPSSLEVVAFGNIEMSGSLGSAPSLYAGADIVKAEVLRAGNVIEKAGRHISAGQSSVNVFAEDPGVGSWTEFSYVVSNLNLSAGFNPFTSFADDYQIAGVAVNSSDPTKRSLKKEWISSGPGNISASAITWVAGEGGLTANATGSISLADVHVSYRMAPPAGVTDADHAKDIRQTQQPLSLTAGGPITLNRIESMGPIMLTSANGDITINNTIGAHVASEVPGNLIWNPYDKGPASIDITALNGNVNIQEARAEGNINITAYGDWYATGVIYYGASTGSGWIYGIQSGGSSLLREYIYISPGVSELQYQYVPVDDYDLAISATPVYRLPVPLGNLPVASPGPTIAGPGAPVVPGALPPGAPGIPGVAGNVIPGASGAAGGAEQEIATVLVAGSGALSEIIPVEDDEADKEEQRGKMLKLSGGRGVGQSSDFGRR